MCIYLFTNYASLLFNSLWNYLCDWWNFSCLLWFITFKYILFFYYYISITFFFIDEPCQLIFLRTFKSSLAIGSKPQSLLLADMNNDQKIDIIVLNYGANTFGIFFANSTNGTFQEQKVYSAKDNSLLSSLAIADINNDNYQDIILANYGANSLTIYLNLHNETFFEYKSISLGQSRPLFIKTAYLNNDSRIDIVVVNYGTASIGILLSNGNASFEDPVLYSTGYDSLPLSAAIGDLNNDNYLDIVVCNSGTDNIGIFYGYGNGLFANQIIYSTNYQSQPTSITLANINNDNFLDIIVSNNGSNNIGVFLNNQTGSFRQQITYSLGTTTYSQYITCADMNKDSYMDVILVDEINSQVQILLGIGNGSFSMTTIYDDLSQSSPYSVAVYDFNHNNQSDIVLTNSGANQILLLMDYFVQSAAKQINYDDGKASYTGSFVLNDFNQDKILDIVSYTDVSLFILFGGGDGTFDNKRLFPIANPSNVESVTSGDVNNDNYTDIVLTDIYSSTVGIFLGYGNGNFAPIHTYSTGLNSQPYFVVIKDINSDNKVDLIVAVRSASKISIFLGFGNGTFMDDTGFSTGSGTLPVSLAVADINNDNYEDIIVLFSTGDFIVYVENGQGSFSFWTKYSSSFNAGSTSIVLFDYNNDSYLDVFITETLVNSIRIFSGTKSGTFPETIDIMTGPSSAPSALYITDLNHDNYADLLVSYYGQNGVIILYGYGNGTFIYQQGYSTGTGSQPYGLLAYDLDDDQNDEIIVALIGRGSISILSQYYAAEFENEISYSTGSSPQPYSANVGHFNRNNQIDIVVANTGEDQLEILLDFQSDTYANKTIYSLDINSHPQSVITCDVNQDGHLDLVNVNTDLGTISIIKG